MRRWLRSDRVRFKRTGPVVLLYAAPCYRCRIPVALGIFRRRSSCVHDPIAFLSLVAWLEISVLKWTRVHTSTLMPLAYGGIVVSGIGDAVFWTGIREIGAYRPVIYDTLVPPVAIVIAVLILGQFFATLQTFGVSATLARLALMRLAPGRPSPWPE